MSINSLAPRLLWLALISPVTATVLTDFNSGNIVTDFEFNDAAGTTIENTVNTGTEGGSWDTDGDLAGTSTNGAGQFDASGKANTDFGSVYVDINGINSGRVLALFHVSWSFDDAIYDPAQDEEFRLSLITFDPRSTFVTAETFFTRTGADEVTMYGNAVGTGASDTPDVFFGGSGSLLTIFDIDLDAATAELFYSSDGGANFSSAGVATLDPTRGIESVRLVLNEDYSDDSLLIERAAVSVIPEPSVAVLGLLGLVPFFRRRR
ncbi:hypothetical protein HAHE_21220 [Haloferula helveola]|uniref:PEP-CTERM protein-sorting domain-containing protein n=1 Tax=Haloferula helveola TaxID=490095 RepID=A0ABM7RG68_9BACT|nr:hypothetical protein HAHE_21220 [Haloferula helveola]